MLWQYFGIALLSIVIFQLAIFVVAQMRRLTLAKQVGALEVSLLEAKLETLRKQRKKQESFGNQWSGNRKFEVKSKVKESNEITSFYLVPHDRRPLPDFKPGQFLTFQLNLPSSDKPLVRCYSLSDSPKPDYYRISIKKVPGGRGSQYFNECVKEGDILDVRAPSGKFFLDTQWKGGLVLIGGGIGLTPVLSMLNYLVNEESNQEVYVFYGIRNRTEHIMKKELEAIASQHSNIHVHICYSQPSPNCSKNQDYHHHSRINIQLLKDTLPTKNFEFYFCGPGSMMESLSRSLNEWGVSKNRIHFETFGPSSVKKLTRPPMPLAESNAGRKVTFNRTGKNTIWNGAQTTLLELAEANHIVIPSGCRAGSCGTCLVAVQKGEVDYCREPSFDPEPGSCLACIATPKTDLQLDA